MKTGEDVRFKNLDLNSIDSVFHNNARNSFQPNTSCQPQFNTQRGERTNAERNYGVPNIAQKLETLPNLTNISIGGSDNNSTQIVTRGIRAGNMASRGPNATRNQMVKPLNSVGDRPNIFSARKVSTADPNSTVRNKYKTMKQNV